MKTSWRWLITVSLIGNVLLALLIMAIFVPGPWRWPARYVLELGPSWAPTLPSDEYRQSMFRVLDAEHNAPGSIVFLGEDLMAFAPWDELFPDLPIRNRSIAGNTSFDIVRRAGEVLDTQPAAIFVMMGYNDLLREVHPNTIISNHRRLFRDAASRSPSTRIYVIKPIAFPKAGLLDHPKATARLSEVYEELERIMAERDEVLLDLRQPLSIRGGVVTFSPETYLALREAIREHVMANMPTGAPADTTEQPIP